MTESTKPWPSLRAFLDAGGEIETAWPDKRRGVLIEHLYTEASALPPAARERAILVATHWSEEPYDDEHGCSAWMGFPTSPEEHLAECRREAWYAEMLAEPDLVDRLRTMLTPAERAGGERRGDLHRRPHPLRVAIPDGNYWRCYSCGRSFDKDTTEAIIVGDRSAEDKQSFLDYEIEYCRDCIAMALAAYDAGRN